MKLLIYKSLTVRAEVYEFYSFLYFILRLEYFLVRVVELNDNNKPILSLDDDIIEFLFKVSAKDNLDYYL